MRKVCLLLMLSVVCTIAAFAAPVECLTQNNPVLLSDLMGQAYADGCLVQDKLFSNFSYGQGVPSNPDSSSVMVSFALTPGSSPPAGDLHVIQLTSLGVSWTAPFVIGYRIAVYNAPPGTGIVEASFDLNVPGGNTLPVGAKQLTGSNGTYFINASVGSPGSTTINYETALDVIMAVNPAGEAVSSLVDSYSQGVIPEPGTWALIGGGLAAFGVFRRRRG